MKDVRKKLSSIVAEQLSIKTEEIGDDVTFDILGVDSLDRVEIVMKIEEEFDIEMNDDEAEKLKTFSDLLAYVTQLLEQAAAK
ncbi:MAG: acyl carrier protein [Candidatus Babeliaceae bacterium]|nr:acyl carrier protein [Candidatus Babeliaceae bacterium]